MSFNETPSSERLKIGFFGRRNAGKSSLVNAVTGQKLSVVSQHKGTTTDPVKKAMELLPLGPVVIIDTPGIDDEGELGTLRVKKTKEILKNVDIAVLVVDATTGITEIEQQLISFFTEGKTPYIIAYNKSDLVAQRENLSKNEICVSAIESINIDNLKKMLGCFVTKASESKYIIDDILKKGDFVVLVTPVDEAAPKGRLILPQQIVLRNILDNGCFAVVCKDTELEVALKSFSRKPDLVITDSQAFGFVNKIIPQDIRLTSFSIIFARYKGELDVLVQGADMLDALDNGDKVLISEGCTHHRQCNDIGSVKMPSWIRKYTDKDVVFEFTSGVDFPENLNDYKLVVHCGGCMLSEKEMKNRIELCKKNGVPVVNYGMAIAKMNGILDRSLEVFIHTEKAR